MNQQRLVFQCKVQKLITNSNKFTQREFFIYDKTIVICRVNQDSKLTGTLEQYELQNIRISWQFQESALSSFKINQSATYFAEEKYLNKIKSLLDAKTFYCNFYNDYEVKCVISQRKTSQIVKCQNIHTKQIKIAKILKTNSNYEADIAFKMKNYPHKYILANAEIYLEDQRLILVMDFCEGGSLFNYFAFHNFKIPNEDAIKIMRRVLKAVSHLHDLNIIHRDLKSDNIMLMRQNDISSIKIIDFGLAIQTEKQVFQFSCGTPGYIAPEILNCQPYNELCDIYSLGCLYHSLISGQKLFPQNISRQQLFQLNKENKIRISDKIESNEIKELIKMMLSQESERPSADDCLNFLMKNKNKVNTIEGRVKAMCMPDLKNPFKKQ